MDWSPLQPLLPVNVRDMVDRIGLPATLVVVKRLGGVTWRVAEGRSRNGQAKRAALAQQIGHDVEALLHQEYAGEEIYLARCQSALLRWRDVEINRKFEDRIRKGQTARKTVAVLAREYRLSDRRVWDILKQPGEMPGHHSRPFE